MSPCLLLLSALVTADPAPEPAAPQVRQAVERSLPFLLKSSEAWREKKACVSCHQVPFTIWPYQDAHARGFAVEPRRLDDLTGWALNFCTTHKHEGKFTGGFLSTMGKTVLALQDGPKSEKVAEAFAHFAPLIVGYQKPEGWWKEGNFIGVKGAEREGIEVDTMWIILAIDALERLGDEKNREALAKSRERGLAWLKDAKPATRTDWLALRILVETRFDDPKNAAEWRQSLLKQQKPDGGWPFVRDGDSHPLVTGEVLYLLNAAGIRDEDRPAIQRAQQFLVSTQQGDGSWKSASRAKLGAGVPNEINDINIHWATGWATIGLLRTMPEPKSTAAGN